jgi:hypothetical protein
MLRTKLRPTIAVLASAFTVALAAGPIVPQALAKPNNGGFSRSNEAMHSKLRSQSCGNMLDLYNLDLTMRDEAVKAGDYAAAFRDVDQAAKDRGAARNAGCGWGWT